MKFFLVAYSSEEKTIGFFPQVSQGKVPVSVDDPRFLSAFMSKKTSAETVLPEYILYKKARLTDLVSVSFPGSTGNLAVSLRLASIVQKSRHTGLEFLPTKLHAHLRQVEDIIILHPYEYAFKFLDLQNTRIAHRKTPDQNLHFANSEELVARLKADEIQVLKSPMGFTPIFLHSFGVKADAEIDCFSLRNLKNGGIGLVVSEKLKDQITDAGCTGLEFKNTLDL
jgi:hypothetical protein